jgi:hypothetical protein
MIDKLPTHPFIACSTPECDSKTTCFGKNLEQKIKQVGSLEQLLSTFKCRVCRGGSQPLRAEKIKKIKVPRVTKTQARIEKVQEMVSGMPKLDISARAPVPFLRDSPETVRSITTNGSCIRPDIFLNSNRVCDDCGYNQCCQSNVKTFSKYYKPQQV